MVLVRHAFQNEEPTRKIKFSETIWFIILFVDKDTTSLLPTFKFNYDSFLFLQTNMLEDHQVSSHDQLGKMLCKCHFQIIISSDSCWQYCALLTAFLSNWTILSLSKWLQFLLTVSSEERISSCLRKSSKQLVKWDSLEHISSTLISLSINSSIERFSSWLFVQAIMIYEYRWQYKN